jgi:hypothetical protein
MNSAQTKQLTFASGSKLTITMFFSGRGCSFGFETLANGKIGQAFEPKPLRLAGHPEIVACVGKLALNQSQLDQVNEMIAELQATPEYATHMQSMAEYRAIPATKTVIDY